MTRRRSLQFGGLGEIAPIFSVWGQSNAEGGYLVSSAMPPEWQGISPEIQVANYGSVDNGHGAFNWQPANLSGTNENCASVYSNKYPGAVHSVEQSLARALIAHYGTTVYLDKLARGAMAISQWKPGGFWYDELLTIAADEKASLAGLGKTPVWLPVIWIQGENNAGGSAASYQGELQSVIDSERARSIANRPWIFQKLSTYQTQYSPSARASINDAFDAIAAGGRPNCYTLDPSAFTLTMAPDAPGLHYSSAAHVTLGYGYFDLMLANGLLP